MNFDWTLLLVGALVTWRVTRFIIADDLIAGTRGKVKRFLDQPRDSKSRDQLAEKAYFLLTCPWCVAIYVSAGFLFVSRLTVVDSVPVPVWSWLAVSALALVPYQLLDGDWDLSVKGDVDVTTHRGKDA